MQIGWHDVQGIYDVQLEVQGESLMRQERRSENSALLTMALQGAGMSAQFGAILNIRRFWERLLDSYGIADKATYFSTPPGQAAAAQAALPPGASSSPSGAPGTPPQAASILDQMQNGSVPAGGITNEALARTGAGRSV